MKYYLGFANETYYPSSGVTDFVKASTAIEVVKDALDARWASDKFSGQLVIAELDTDAHTLKNLLHKEVDYTDIFLWEAPR